jgi:GntR family transcriptional regulator/MocR family aminotransferase
MSQRNDSAIWSGLFRISAESGQTLQAQIRQAIVAAILDRQIAASMPLPSCRILAEKLGVARGTVVLAFQQLVDQGFLIARERRGHFVNPEVLATPAKPSPSTPSRPGRASTGSRGASMTASDMPKPAKKSNWIKSPIRSSTASSIRRCSRPPNGANATAWRWPCWRSATGRPTWSTGRSGC